MCAASLAPCVADVNHPGAPQPCGREGPGPGAPADYVTWYLPRRFSTTEDGNVASAYASSSYSMPGMWVTERTVQVPLDWAAPDGERIDLFIRELVDPDRRSEDLPLLTYLQGGPGGASPRPVNGRGSSSSSGSWWTRGGDPRSFLCSPTCRAVPEARAPAP